MSIESELRDALRDVMYQAENDLASAHAEIIKLQGKDPKDYTWPEWSPQANTLRWFAQIRQRFSIADPRGHNPTHSSAGSPAGDKG